jgi:glucan phosphoethanolaminetransferase (alkaline phosphatase superfamily)
MVDRLWGLLRGNVSLAMKELERNRGLVLVLFLLAAAAVAPSLVIDGPGGVRSKLFSLLLGVGLLLLAFVQRHAFFALCLALLPANLVYQHLERRWGERHLDSRIEAAFESPPAEALEYLRAHLDVVDGVLLLIGLIYLVVLVGVALRGRSRQLVALRNVACLALAAWLVAAVALRVDQKLTKFPPIQLIAEIFEAKHRYALLDRRRQYLMRHPLEGQQCASNYDKVVIVLGESAVSDHRSVFGYPKPTTPFAVESKPYTFDALAPSNQTRYAIPMMLTDAGPGTFGLFYREHSLVGQLRACGFRTLWISNQGKIGMYDSFTTSLALEADEQVFLNEWSWAESQDDGRIVAELAARGVYSRRKQATFIHLIGSHVSYDERYPEGFGFADVAGTVAEYDNSLLYTDHVLSQLYERFRDDSLLFIYVSDHGQFVSEKEFGSGFLPGYREEYRVPLLIWTRDAASIGGIRSAIGDAKLNTDSLNHVVRFLLGHEPSPRVSTARNVTVLTPENVRVYDDLAAFGHGD